MPLRLRSRPSGICRQWRCPNWRAFVIETPHLNEHRPETKARTNCSPIVPQERLPALPTKAKSGSSTGLFERVSEGTRTPDRLDHNQELYRLSYAHHGEVPGV